MPHKGHFKNTRAKLEWKRLQSSRPYIDHSKPLPKPHHLPEEIARIMLGYITIDNDYCHNMSNFALVETSWYRPAMHFLYTHVKFGSYEGMVDYLLKVRRSPSYGSAARTMSLSNLSGPSDPEIYLCRLVESCPNIVSFKTFKCPSSWITDAVLLTMGTRWPYLVDLSLHFRNRCYGNMFITAVKGWPDLTRLDLTNVSGIDENQYCQIIKFLPNLRSLRLSRQDIEQSSRDRMSDGLLRTISNTSRLLKVIEFNNCTRLSNSPMLNCFKKLADTLECLIITGCKQISGIILAEIIAACDSLRFVNVSRSSFNDEALCHLCGTRASDGRPEVAPRICQWIEQFAMSGCSGISLAQFRLFAGVLGSRVRDGHVKSCIVYIQHMAPNLHKHRMKEIEKFNPGLKIKASCEGFVLDEIIESVVGPMVGRLVAPVTGAGGPSRPAA